jgi:riboflavin kinase / FMN adenylyltransferase
MQLVYALGTPASMGPAALTINFFDGVHLGHQRLAERASQLAHPHGPRSLAVTFWPQPLALLRPEVDDGLLTTLERKLALLAALGTLDATLVVPFTPELATGEPEAVLEVLSQWCEPRALVVGPEFALGRAQTGDLAFLRATGARRGFTVESVEVEEDGAPVRSARIRRLIREGEVAQAARLLGRPHRLAGEVVLGDQRGRLLGFPTANLRTDPRLVLPANGVYAVRVRLPGEADATHAGVANIGVRPTFSGEPQLRVEVYLLDVTMDLYGLRLDVELVARLRDEQRFDGVDALKAQIGRDSVAARALLAQRDEPTSEQGR